MKDTRNKILTAARKLFNEEGLNNVTLRQIAKLLNISQGNLNYHFKLKEDILEALYFNLVEEMDWQLSSMNTQHSHLNSLYETSKLSMEIMYDYRFILIDYSYIMNTNSPIKSHYGELQKNRSNQFQLIFSELIKNGLIRPAEFDSEYPRLYERMNIVGDGWINVYTTFGAEKSIGYYCDLLFEMIYTYLTDVGKQQYMAIKKYT